MCVEVHSLPIERWWGVFFNECCLYIFRMIDIVLYHSRNFFHAASIRYSRVLTSAVFISLRLRPFTNHIVTIEMTSRCFAWRYFRWIIATDSIREKCSSSSYFYSIKRNGKIILHFVSFPGIWIKEDVSIGFKLGTLQQWLLNLSNIQFLSIIFICELPNALGLFNVISCLMNSFLGCLMCTS